MINFYLIKTLFLALYSGIIIFLYYFIFPGHSEFNLEKVNIFGNIFEIDKSFIFFMIFFILIYLFYSIFKNFLKKDEKIIFSPAKITGFFIIFLFLNCILYFLNTSFNFSSFGNLENYEKGFLLFLKIIYFSIFPIILFFILTGFGKKIIGFLPKINDFSSKTRFLFSLNLGFFSFLFLLTIFSFFGIYNLSLVFFILGFFLAFGGKEVFGLLKNFFKKEIILDEKEGEGIKLFLSEIFCIIAFFLISTGLISIVRPYPIGWDDLGVYMNFPNILAHSSGIASFGEMHTWQIFTGIGYLFGESAFAFFINFSGYFLSFFTLFLIFSDLFEKKLKDKKSFLPLPIILSTLFLGLPMSIFQSIKDMKLDQGLFFITTFSIYFFYLFLEKFSNDKKFPKIYLFIIGILVGFAFSIKFTSLFLIISILAILSFFHFGVFGFLGILSFILSFFTFGNLWEMMNVSIEKNIFLVSFSFILGILFFLIGVFKNKFKVKNYFKQIFVFLLGIFLALFPWFLKNIFESYPKISISSIIKGNPDKPNLDLKNAFSLEEIGEKNLEKARNRELEPITTNEDLRRFLGYESGILPYTNMAWNLTMQTNQGRKFTEISFIFFALIPLVFIFLPFFRKKFFWVFLVIILFLQILFFIDKDFYITENNLKNISENVKKEFFVKVSFKENNEIFYKFKAEDLAELEKSLEKNLENKDEILEIWKENRDILNIFRDFLSKINLPFGYFIIFLFFIIPFLVLDFFLKKEEKTLIFRLNLAFLTIYIFLWCISSFGIAWYGITMYFALLLSIFYAGFYISVYDENSKNYYNKFFGSLVFVIIFIIFMIFTVIPHTIENFKIREFTDYKTWKKSAIYEVFELHSRYDKIFFELNISEKENFLNDKINNPLLPLSKNEILKEEDFPEVIDTLKNKAKNGDKNSLLTLEKIYFGILYPEEKYLNNEKIYRIGTFFKYYIAKNHKRVFEDALIFYFNDYLYDKNPEKTWENTKKLGIKYLIVDLGAATIDKSETHGLTNRYEKLLKSFRAENLKLIETDSICLRFALQTAKNDEKKFFRLSSGTFESYDENGREIGRNEKLKNCAFDLEKFVNSIDFDRKNFSYLKKFEGKNEEEIFRNLEKGKYVIFEIKN